MFALRWHRGESPGDNSFRTQRPRVDSEEWTGEGEVRIAVDVFLYPDPDLDGIKVEVDTDGDVMFDSAIDGYFLSAGVLETLREVAELVIEHNEAMDEQE